MLLDPALLWLWHRSAAAAWIHLLAQELPYPCAMGVAVKKKKKKKKKKEEEEEGSLPSACVGRLAGQTLFTFPSGQGNVG